jgi:hypothetical protein
MGRQTPKRANNIPKSKRGNNGSRLKVRNKNSKKANYGSGLTKSKRFNNIPK